MADTCCCVCKWLKCLSGGSSGEDNEAYEMHEVPGSSSQQPLTRDLRSQRGLNGGRKQRESTKDESTDELVYFNRLAAFATSPRQSERIAKCTSTDNSPRTRYGGSSIWFNPNEPGSVSCYTERTTYHSSEDSGNGK